MRTIYYFLRRSFHKTRHLVKRIYTRYKYGVSCCKATSICYDWAKQLRREIAGYKQIARKSVNLTHDGFDKDIDEMLEAFDLIMDDDISNSDWNGKGIEAKVEKGLQLFAKRFRHFWY